MSSRAEQARAAFAALAIGLIGVALPARGAPAGAAPSPAATAAPSAPAAVVTVQLPFPAESADAAYDKAGNLHVTFARGKSFFYTARPAGTKTFRPPITLGTLKPGLDPESPPQIAVWPKGNPCALWKGGGSIMMSLSGDGGKTFQSISTDQLLVPGANIEVPTLLIGGDAAMHLVWVDHRDPVDPNDQVATHLYFATTRDKGKTWTKPRALTREVKGAKRACPCCQPAVAAGAAGELWIAYRSSHDNIKEIALLMSGDSGRTFRVNQLTEHRWYVKGCPASGPSLATAGNHMVLIWLSEQDLFSTTSSDAGRSFKPPVRLGTGFFHQAAGNKDRAVMLFEQGDKTLAWRAGDAAPARVDAPPKGTLVANPAGHFELIAFERGEE